MNARKLSVVLSLFWIVAILLTACGTAATPAPATVAPATVAPPPVAAATQAPQPTSEPAKPAKLTFWMQKTFVDSGNASMEAHVVDFTNATGIPVDFRLISVDDLPTQWSAAIESGNVPDVSYFGYEDLGQFYNQGVLLDVGDAVKEAQAKYGNFTPALLQSVTVDGKYWGVPMWAEPTVLYYRKDLFQAAGIANPPDTWDEFLADAQKLTNPAKGIYGAGFGLGTDCSDSEWWMRDIIYDNGASLNAADGKTATVTTPEFKQSMQWLNDFWTKDNVNPPGVIGWDDGGNNTAYLTGQVAMVINTGSIYNKIFNTSDYPDLQKTTAIAVIPQGPKGRYITGIENVMGVFKASKNPYWAQKLMVWMMDKEWQRTWMHQGSYLMIPSYPDLSQDPFWQTDAGKVFAAVPQYFAFLGYPGPYTPGSGQVANNRLLTLAMQKIVVEKQPIDAVLSQFEIDLNAVLQK